jgi:NAD+ kinase
VSGPPRRIGVVLHPERDTGAVVDAAARWARRHGAKVVCGDEAGASDLVLAAGGDGTVLRALHVAAPARVPVLGVNMGRLGYLTELDPGAIEEGLEAVARGAFALESHTALRVRVNGHAAVAFNDVVLSRPRGRPQAALDLAVDGEPVTRHEGDGLIVASAAGSTAYSFSAGGPILSPRLDALIVTPLAPHATFNRSLVLSPEEPVRIEVAGDGPEVALELDGGEAEALAAGAAVDVEAVPDAARVVRLGRAGFGARAREKL